MTPPTEPPFKDALVELQEATENISLDSSFQHRPLKIPGAASVPPQDPDAEDNIDIEPSPNADDDSIPHEFKAAVTNAYILADQWERYGHPTQPQGSDPIEYNFDLENFKPGPGNLVVDDMVFTIKDYFGEKWSDIIRNLNAVEPFESDMLTTKLFPHQKQGVAKILELFKGPFYGGILGDDLGLGKILMTLLSCTVDRIQQKRRGCFSLVITPRSVQYKWASECKHFKPENRPVVYVLTDGSMTVTELLDENPDFVIVTPELVEAQYEAWMLHEKFKTLVATEGYAAACQKHPKGKDGQKSVNLSLFSPVYADQFLPFTHVVVDEVHYFKDVESSIHKAIKSLHRTCTLIVSGTFMPNRWNDIFACLDLLPGHPFVTKADFERIFGQDGLCPRPTQFNTLVKFLQAMVIARPKSALQLRDVTIIDHQFRLSKEDEEEVYFQMFIWYRSLQRLEAKNKDASSSASKQEAKELTESILALVNRAQVCAGHTLASYSVVGEEKEIRNHVKDAVQAFKKQFEAIHEDHALRIPTEPSLIMYDEQVRRAHHLLQKGIVNVTNMVPQAYKPSNKQPMTREKWLKLVEELYKDGRIWSGRVKTIYELVQTLRKNKPNEKIVIFSKYLKFLDLLAEVFAHMEGEPAVYRFDNGEKQVRREITRQMFMTDDKNDFCIMLAVANPNNIAGIELSAASVVIQCEVWWDVNDERQAWSRVQRPDQKKSVTIYRLSAENSLVDYHIQTVRDAQAKVIDKFMEQLRREDHEEPDIPVIVPY